MQNKQDIWTFLEEYQINDDILAKSYENTSTKNRALIKAAIAFHFSVHKMITPQTLASEQFFNQESSGLFCALHKKTSPFLICYFEDDFASPARLLSVLCPAVISGVKEILLFFEKQAPTSVLTCLDLAGIENIYIIGEEQKNPLIIMDTFFKFMQTKQDDSISPLFSKEAGRFIYFSNKKSIAHNKTYRDFALKAHALNMNVFFENSSPRIYAKNDCVENISFAYENNSFSMDIAQKSEEEATLSFSQFKANTSQLLNEETSTNSNNYDISFSTNILAKQNYKQGMELCYIHPEISLDFFQNTHICANI